MSVSDALQLMLAFGTFIVALIALIVELINKQTSKGVALSSLTDKLNLTADNVMAIGNAQNDESMIEFAGTGVAMANSIPHTLQMADVVTESDNNHDGVAEAIEKYVLNA